MAAATMNSFDAPVIGDDPYRPLARQNAGMATTIP
jgi:hypothetical protein